MLILSECLLHAFASPATHRALHPAVVAYEADGGVLELVKNGRVTALGRLWDEEQARGWGDVTR